MSPSTSASSSSQTTTLPPPPQASPTRWIIGDDGQSFMTPSLRSASSSHAIAAASSREPGAAARNRRRSQSHVALLESVQTQQAQVQIQQQQQQQQQQAAPRHSRSSSVSSALTDTLLPTLSPSAESRFDAYSPDKPYLPGQPKSLSGIAIRAFGLGFALAVGLISTATVLALTSSPLWRLPFFLSALATFHFLEFWTTAAYNTREADISSFLLTANWPAYAIAHTAASLECLLTNVLFPGRTWAPYHLGTVGLLLGLACVIVGQTVRSAAMVQAGPSFNHIVQHTQKREHILVTTGIYGSLRHPSYFGFFWWGLGTQLVMGNVICFVGYSAILWNFFASRIQMEEGFLVKFFGGEYVDYRKKVGTKIPFVP